MRGDRGGRGEPSARERRAGWGADPVDGDRCPVCECPLDRFDLAAPDQDYLCPGCGTRTKPGGAGEERETA
jgi:hypothetical protein